MSLTKQNISPTPQQIKKSFNKTAQICQTLLSTLNRSDRWKNTTNASKMLKTLDNQYRNQDKNNFMTQDDIDRLFEKFNGGKKDGRDGRDGGNGDRDSKQCRDVYMGKNKIKTDWGEGGVHADQWGAAKRNYIHGVKFLRMEEPEDKFMTGVDKGYMEQDHIQDLFSRLQEHKDFTAEFKQNYLVGKVIGQGAYASVRVAIYKPNDKKIAIKIYQKQKIKEPQRKKSIRRQITILSLLSHKNIVKLLNVVQSNNHLNLIMQYIPGTSLGTYLKSQPKNKIQQKQCKKIFYHLAKALKYMHSLNIAHRDIKLENVILCDQLDPKIIDFGFSTCIEADKKIKIFCGTPSYMAPEVVQRREYRGEGADVWALGVMLFVCVTGIFPFKGATDQELYKKINSSDYPKAQLLFSRQISDLMSKMLKIDPEQRITASQVIDILSQIIKHPWFHQQSLSKKKNTETSLQNHRKRINTQNSTSFKENKWAHKTGLVKNILCQTSNNQKLHLQLKMTLNSPKVRQEIQSYRLSYCNNKENAVKLMKADRDKEKEKQKEKQKQKEKEKEKEKDKQRIKNNQKKQKMRGEARFIELIKIDHKKRDLDKSKNKRRL